MTLACIVLLNVKLECHCHLPADGAKGFLFIVKFPREAR